MKFGRNRPIARGPRFAVKNYLMASLPDPPSTINYAPKAQPFLANPLGNTDLGDCTCAGIFHLGGLWLGNAGASILLTQDQCIDLYCNACGYVRGNPDTDQGGDEQTVLNYVQQNGLVRGSHKITAWMAVNGLSRKEVATAMWLFESLYFGIELPDAWTADMASIQNGFVWDVAGDPDPSQGHCVAGVGFNNKGVQIDSWGLIGTITWAAIAKYATTAGSGELYTILGPDAIDRATGKSPVGFDSKQLLVDLESMGIA